MIAANHVIRALALAGVFSIAVEAVAEDWPRWRGPDLNGISKEKHWTTAWPKDGPTQLWKASVGIGFSSVAVAQGRVFTLGNANAAESVYCLDAKTGRELWKHSYPCSLDPEYHEGGPGATPTVDGNRVFTLGKRGHLFCFEAKNGKVIWQKNLMTELGIGKPRWGFAGSPLVEGDLLILNAGDAGIAFNQATGKVIWRSATNAGGYATPVPFTFAGDHCVAIFSAKALVGVRVKDGQVLWRHPWETKWDINIADPILVDDKMFISSFDRGCALLQLTSSDPKVAWQNKSMANHFNSCVLSKGYLYGIDGNTDQAQRDLRCVELATGQVKWKHEGLGLGSLMAADGKLIILSERGELVIAEASPEAFKPLARAQVLGGKCWTVPVLANGRIYCRNAQGSLLCLDVRGKAQ
jgi:outer membrane protein assembly factor BamB